MEIPVGAKNKGRFLVKKSGQKPYLIIIISDEYGTQSFLITKTQAKEIAKALIEESK